MAEQRDDIVSRLIGRLTVAMRRSIFRVLSMGPIPEHIAFIMDGNRRFAKKWNLTEGGGHKAGFLALMSVLKYCYELGVKYVTVYAFSIDNFKRRANEVQYVMDLMQEKIEGFLKEMSIVNKYGVRVLFIGDLNLLDEPVRAAAQKAMQATAHNTGTVLLVCMAYTSVHEMSNAVYKSCCQKNRTVQHVNGIYSNGDIHENGGEEFRVINVIDLEENMYMAAAPDPDILVRSSGETRLSNFLLWQTSNSLLYSPKALWPEIGLKHVVWAILKFQMNYRYLEKEKKQS